MVTVRRKYTLRGLLTENLYLNLERSGATAATCGSGGLTAARPWRAPVGGRGIRRPARARGAVDRLCRSMTQSVVGRTG